MTQPVQNMVNSSLIRSLVVAAAIPLLGGLGGCASMPAESRAKNEILKVKDNIEQACRDGGGTFNIDRSIGADSPCTLDTREAAREFLEAAREAVGSCGGSFVTTEIKERPEFTPHRFAALFQTKGWEEAKQEAKSWGGEPGMYAFNLNCGSEKYKTAGEAPVDQKGSGGSQGVGRCAYPWAACGL